MMNKSFEIVEHVVGNPKFAAEAICKFEASMGLLIRTGDNITIVHNKIPHC